MRLDGLGVREAESTLDMSNMEQVKHRAGVFDPVAVLPQVPVIDSLLSTLSQVTTAPLHRPAITA